jgi:hypothetical protein
MVNKIIPYITLFILYILCLVLTLSNENAFLLAGEHLTTNDPLMVVSNLINNFNWIEDSLVRHSSLPRGMHQGPLNNIIFYLIIYFGSFLYLDSTSTQLFFGLTLQFFGIRLILKNINSRFDNYTILILFSFWVLNYQNLELILGGGFFAINLGILTLIVGFLELLSKNKKLTISQLIELVFLLVLFVYIGIVWINILIIILLLYYLRILFQNYEVFNYNFLKFSFISLIFVLPYLYIIYNNPIPFYWSSPPQDIIFAITSGIYKKDISDDYYTNSLIKIILVSLILVIFIDDIKKNKNYIYFFLYIFFCLWELSSLGNIILNYVPLFHNFRATYKLSIITTLILLYVISKNITANRRIRLILYLILFFQLFYILNFVKNLSYTKIPDEYFQAQSYLNSLNEKKLLLPLSLRETTISNSYSWLDSNQIYWSEYPSNIFSTIIPIKNSVAIDSIDNPSYLLSSMQLDFNSINNIQLFMRKYNFKYLIYDNNKRSIKELNFNEHKDLILLKSFGKIDVYEIQDLNLNNYFSSYFINESLRRNFFKENINKKGLIDYVNDRNSMDYFVANNINPYPIFEIQNPWGQPQFQSNCLKINSKVTEIIFYNPYKNIINLKTSSNSLNINNEITINPNFQFSFVIPAHKFKFADFCISADIQGSIFFSAIF